MPRIIKYYTHLSLSDEKKNEESVFVPLEQPPQEAGDKDEADAKENDDSFEKVEAFGRGSAKVSSFCDKRARYRCHYDLF